MSLIEVRKGGLPTPTELFILRFQTVWMRDKDSTLPGKAKNVGFQSTEYSFLLLCSGVVLSSLSQRGEEGQPAVEGET